MIIIKWHHHNQNSGFGNKLLLSCFAECHAIETGQQVFNWLVTDILEGGDRGGVFVHDNRSIKWGHLPNMVPSDARVRQWMDGDIQKGASIVGVGTNLSDHEFHQTDNDISLIKKHKKALVKDFGRREGTFVHVRTPDNNRWKSDMVPDVEYYKRALPASCSGYVASNGPNHPTVRYLLDNFDLKFYNASTSEEIIIFGSTFNNKVLSLGTFSWWIGFIGNQNNVICPNPNNYRKWHGPIFEQIDGWTKI
tara:strand:- start:6918 stop:7667 length:750 start_codon:yes stop_codon:yes gene_type:complete